MNVFCNLIISKLYRLKDKGDYLSNDLLPSFLAKQSKPHIFFDFIYLNIALHSLIVWIIIRYQMYQLQKHRYRQFCDLVEVWKWNPILLEVSVNYKTHQYYLSSLSVEVGKGNMTLWVSVNYHTYRYYQFYHSVEEGKGNTIRRCKCRLIITHIDYVYFVLSRSGEIKHDAMRIV